LIYNITLKHCRVSNWI